MHASNELLYLILLIVAARAGGEISERFHQPAVFGEIVAGIVLGIIPALHPAVDSEAIMFVAEIGVILLLFEVGLESELADFLKVGAPAALVAAIGVVLPLFLGFGAMRLLGYDTYIALFLGATLTATSVGITARVFNDLRMMHRKEAKIVIGAAVVDDILGLLVLSVVLGLVGGAALRVIDVGRTVGMAVAFLVAAIVIGHRAAPFLISLTRKMRGRGVLVVSAFGFGLVVAYLGSLLGLAAIVGAFAAGLVLASTEDRVHITEKIQPVADIFVPVFFAQVGMRVDLGLLNPARPENWPVLGLGAVLLAIAIPTKLASGLGAIKQRADKLTIGIGMVPRGEVGLIFASIGLHNAILNQSVYGAVILVLLVTTLMTPPWLKHRLSRVQKKAKETDQRQR
ncbi:MAG: cation:proton antiporter [Armatimonadetes bacterium]|nr:cation:proton antiporter [Armatimonadota bacterium]